MNSPARNYGTGGFDAGDPKFVDLETLYRLVTRTGRTSTQSNVEVVALSPPCDRSGHRNSSSSTIATGALRSESK